MLALELTTIDLDNAARIAVEDFGKRFDRPGLPRSGRYEQEEYAHRAALWGEPRPVKLNARYDVLQGVGLPHYPAREESDQFFGVAAPRWSVTPFRSYWLTHVNLPHQTLASARTPRISMDMREIQRGLRRPQPTTPYSKYRQGPRPT